MKIISFFFLTSLISLNCFSQSLEGEWKGNYFTVSNPGNPIPIDLKFILNEDSSYTVYSYSRGATSVCEVLYIRINRDSIYLEETKNITQEYQNLASFQKMKLKILQKKKSIELNGIWISGVGSKFLPVNHYGFQYGKVRFYKKKNKK